MGVDEAGDKGRFADALGAEDDDFRFEGVWGLCYCHGGVQQEIEIGKRGCRMKVGWKVDACYFMVEGLRPICFGCLHFLA